jgi:hypothetical protein
MVDWGRPFDIHSDSLSDMIGEIKPTARAQYHHHHQHHHAKITKRERKKRKKKGKRIQTQTGKRAVA